MEHEFFKEKLKNCMRNANMSAAQVKAIAQKFDLLAARTSAEFAFEELLDTFGNELQEPKTVMLEARASLLEHLESINKNTILADPIARYERSLGWEQRMKIKYKLPRGLEICGQKPKPSEVPTVTQYEARGNWQGRKVSFSYEIRP
jgi:hypothetical protein